MVQHDLKSIRDTPRKLEPWLGNADLMDMLCPYYMLLQFFIEVYWLLFWPPTCCSSLCVFVIMDESSI